MRMRPGLLFITIIVGLTSRAQQPNLFDYIPDPTTNYAETPVKKVRVVAHVIQYSESDPRNFTIEDTAFFQHHLDMVNYWYSNLKPPTCPVVDTMLQAIPQARFEFYCTEVLFHLDSVLWDHNYKLAEVISGASPWLVDSVNTETNAIYINKNKTSYMNTDKSGVFFIKEDERLEFKFDTTIWHPEQGVMEVRLSSPMSDLTGYEMGFYRRGRTLCDRDIYYKYAGSDSSAIHVFYTGSSFDNIMRGCGPSPYYVNLVNFWGQQDVWGSLLGHEFGHVLGLYHTDSRQFGDFISSPDQCEEPCNNYMGPNPNREWFSPQQLGYMHMLYSTDPNRMRTLIREE